MYKFFLMLICGFVLVSCREAVQVQYSTETLLFVETLVSQPMQEDEGRMISFLGDYQDKFNFAADLKTAYADKSAISQAETLASEGDFENARAVVKERIGRRGLSDALEESLQRLNKTVLLQAYLRDAPNMEIVERTRSFAAVRAHCSTSFKTISSYLEWLERESKAIVDDALNDKKTVLDSMRFVADYLSVTRPSLLGMSLLEMARYESASLFPDVEDNLSQPTVKVITRYGLQKTIDHGYSVNNKSLLELDKKGVASLQEQLAYTYSLAENGQVLKTLESLGELQNLCEVNEKYRRDIIKKLFLAKGWNDASLINRDFLDISYLLETIYMANQ